MFALTLLAAQVFAPTPDHRWATEGIALAKQEGLFVAYPDDGYLNRRRVPSRYEVAVIFHGVATNHLQRLQAFIGKPNSKGDRASLLRSAALLPAYRKASREFAREYRELGVTDDFDQARIAGLTRQVEAGDYPNTKPFRDVPARHWAAKAVGELRGLGLLDGYPDGRFKGGR